VDTLSEDILTLSNALDKAFDNRFNNGFFLDYKTPSSGQNYFILECQVLP